MLHQTEIQFKRSHSSNHVPIMFASFCKLLCFTFLSPSSEVSAWIYRAYLAVVHMQPTHHFFSVVFFDLFFAEPLWCCYPWRWRGLCYWESRRYVHPWTLPQVLGVWDKGTDFALGQSFRVWKLIISEKDFHPPISNPTGAKHPGERRLLLDLRPGHWEGWWVVLSLEQNRRNLSTDPITFREGTSYLLKPFPMLGDLGHLPAARLLSLF